MNESTADRWLSTYTEDDEASTVKAIQMRVSWGVLFFRDLGNSEWKNQLRLAESHAGEEEIREAIEASDSRYDRWIQRAARDLDEARRLARDGDDIAGIDELAEALEEARAMAANRELEADIRPIEDLIRNARPENPRPGRYAI